MKNICFMRDPNPTNVNVVPLFEFQIIEIPNKWTKKIVTYAVAHGTEDMPEDSAERIAVNLAASTWEVEANIILKAVRLDQNPDIKVAWVHSEDDDFMRGSHDILAWAGYVGTQYQGILKLNEDKAWSWDGKSFIINNPDGSISHGKTYNLHQTLRHEFGHLLGLVHGDDPKAVMYPYYNSSLELQAQDITRIQAKYGVRSWISWKYKAFKGSLYRWTRRKPRAITNII